ncbi:MAG: HAD-IB family phosphatase [Candidatus Promineifilaceae bacterium]|nr:HAD-IB family phosphatase [Candidatus Promineifilaceae bacterium]
MRWPYYEHVIFDCDSTLTTIEGIDVLAASVGKQWRVEVLTQAAMDGELDLEDIYAKRLAAVKPTQQQVIDIRQAYKRHIVEDAKQLIEALQSLDHKVYIISGGLLEPVREFGIFLGVPKDSIRAVDVTYNELSGQWWVNSQKKYLTFHEGALTVSDGKAEIIQAMIGSQNGRSILIGDGHSDLMASRAVNLFVGFGGVQERSAVSRQAPVYIQSPSLAPLLVVAAGPAAVSQLFDSKHETLAKKALEMCRRGALKFNDSRLRAKFDAAMKTTNQNMARHDEA